MRMRIQAAGNLRGTARWIACVIALAAMALTVLLLLGGGAYLGMTDWTQATKQPEQTAVVHDLQLLDSNAQLLDQLESIADNNNQDGE